jgi:hypothetical protein
MFPGSFYYENFINSVDIVESNYAMGGKKQKEINTKIHYFYL